MAEKRRSVKSSKNTASTKQAGNVRRPSKRNTITRKSSVRRKKGTSSINNKRNLEIMQKNQFIGVDDTYRRQSRATPYNDGFVSFEREFHPKQVRRKPVSRARRKARRFTAISLFVVLIAVLGIVLSLTVFFKVDKITVAYADKTSRHYTDEELIKESKLNKGENLFLSDKSSAEDRLRDKFPYAEIIDIKIDFPDTLVINITEAKPTYCTEEKGNFLVIGSNDRVLEIAKEKVLNVPLIKGVKLSAEKPGDKAVFDSKSVSTILGSITTAAKQSGLEKITEIDLTVLSDISVYYDNRIKIVLGNNDDLAYKIKTAVAIINEKLSKSDKGKLDVSACNDGKRQSSFLPDNMVTSIAPLPDSKSDTDSDTESDTESYDDTYADDGYVDDGYYYDDTYADDGYADDGYYYDDTYTDDYSYEG